ncbi:hypothetical protein WICPIJ_003384 [Wickerhamomyces pijperi]|uniref:PCI domain-containing protein n=1 Tax=Wickerhamomyces pijperi TaxID=599730 RepID=A0A9P8Q778_WICPI|nr:hypothetical protein WICPIJ_003384 [Wickerhamomyces pijperi]
MDLDTWKYPPKQFNWKNTYTMSDEDFMMSDAESFDFEFEDEEDDDPLGNGGNTDLEDDDEGDDEDAPELDISGVSGSVSQEYDGEGSEDGHLSSNDDNDDANGDAESLYYKAKDLKQRKLEKALPVLDKIIEIPGSSDSEAEEFKFKSIKQSLKILYKLGCYDDFGVKFNQMFTSVNLPLLNKAYVEQSFTKMVDGYFGLPKEIQLGVISKLIVQYKSNERLKLKLLIKKFTILTAMSRFDEILNGLNEVYEGFNASDSAELNKLVNLLEFYAIELQVYLKMNNLPKLKEVYSKTQSITHVVPHSKITAIIKEASGLIYLNDENYDLASSEFFESFKNYDEVGDNVKRVRILKYLIVSSILNTNKINKLESQEIQFFLKNQDVARYLNLLKFFNSLNLTKFEQQYAIVLEQEEELAEVDRILLENLKKIFKSFQLEFLIHYIKPFKRLSLRKISQILKIDVDEIESILIGLKFNDQLPNITLDLIDGVVFNEY